MSGDDETPEQTIADDLVVTKFKMGADIANRRLNVRVALSPFSQRELVLSVSIRPTPAVTVPCATMVVVLTG